MSTETDRIGSGPQSAEQRPDQGKEQTLDPSAAVTKPVESETKADSKSDSESRAPQRKQLKSKKLDRTLQELEKAFTSWESLSGAQAAPAATDDRRKAQTTPNEQEFRNKTRKLLTQLRQQLADLSDEPTSEE